MKKSKLLIVALCISGLFQVHFIKAPGDFFGGARPEPVRLEPVSPREGEGDNDNFERDRGNELRDAFANRSNPTDQGFVRTNGSGKPISIEGQDGALLNEPMILIEGRMGSGKLDKAEIKALEKIDAARPLFEENESRKNSDDVSNAFSRSEQLKKDKIEIIRNFRIKLNENKLTPDVLKQCEGLKEYKIIEKEMQDFYRKITKKDNSDPQEMQAEMEQVVNLIKGKIATLASELYTREANRVMKLYPEQKDAIHRIGKEIYSNILADPSVQIEDPFRWVFKKINNFRKQGEAAKVAKKAAKAAKKKPTTAN